MMKKMNKIDMKESVEKSVRTFFLSNKVVNMSFEVVFF